MVIIKPFDFNKTHLLSNCINFDFQFYIKIIASKYHHVRHSIIGICLSMYNTFTGKSLICSSVFYYISAG